MEELKSGIYTRIKDGIYYEYTILKVMKKTVNVELRSRNIDTGETYEIWFNYRFPRNRFSLEGYERVG